jgi:hypothetical protein
MVYAGSNGSYSLYNDARNGLGYQTGQFTSTPIVDFTLGRSTTVLVGKTIGGYPGAPISRSYNVDLSASAVPTSSSSTAVKRRPRPGHTTTQPTRWNAPWRECAWRPMEPVREDAMTPPSR